jgi:asparagine synthase (glutamine-hydrolysing)
MCGIAGIFNLTGPRPIAPDLLKQMLGAIEYRGPDESGIYVDDWVGLGNTRLSIIDLSLGSQPIHNEDETLWIVFNGEIFNYPELRRDLIQKGHRFYTSTDTEVILHLFEDKGPECLDELNGQFAFAIWNSKEKELFLARDRVGIIPLHYTSRNGCLLFASEIKSIFIPDGIERQLDPIGIDQIFTFWTTLPGRTAFKNIWEVPPGHFLRSSNGNVILKKYWKLAFRPLNEQSPLSLEEICEDVGALIRDSVRIRLRADVTVGCYLSGGLDSSGLTTIVKKGFDHSLKTFGIRFEENGFDEGRFQDQMVSFLQVDHIEVEARNEEIGTFLPDTIWHCEKPVLRTAPVPLFLLSDVVHRNGFKVVLTGEGADEVFGGYNIFRESKVRRFWAKHPESAFRPLLVRRLYPYIFEDHPSKIKPFVQTFFGKDLDQTTDPLFSHLLRWQNSSRVKKFLSDEIREEIGNYDGLDELRGALPEAFHSWDDLAKAQYLEASLFMSNYLLSSQGDRVAMAHSVEVRPPYLDHRIMEYMGKVPSKWKIRCLNEKYVLKKIFDGILPNQILVRPKHPYRAPISESLLSNNALIAHLVSDQSIGETGLFDSRRVNLLFKKLRLAGQASEIDNMALAAIITSQLAYDQFIKNFPYKSIQPVTPKLLFDRRTVKT